MFLIIQNCHHILGALVVCTIAKGALRQRHLVGVTDIQMIVLGAMERMLEVSTVPGSITCYLVPVICHEKTKGSFWNTGAPLCYEKYTKFLFILSLEYNCSLMSISLFPVTPLFSIK